MKYLLFLTSFFWLNSVYGQTIDDALRYSVLDHGGSSRTIGIGGAIGALGADFSTLSTNPGGLGNYRKSEFIVSPFLNFNQANSTLGDSDMIKDSRMKFGFGNLGFIFHKVPQNTKWKAFNIGIGFNQRANFNRNFSFEGRTVGSIADRWLELAYESDGPIIADNLDDFEAGLAYETGAIYDPNSNDGMLEYVNDFFDSPQVLKSQSVDSKGSINELLFSMGANLNNRISIGITAGLPILNYTVQKIYEEVDDGGGRDGDIPAFNSLRFVENLTTSGVGFTLKAGVTLRLSQSLRVGLAAHTPTNLTLNDSYYNLMTFSYNDASGLPVNPSEPNSSPTGVFEYKLRTPFRVLGSAAYIFQKKGFLSAELEYLDYGQNQFNLTDNDNSASTQDYERLLNSDLQQLYGQTINLRVGGEFVLGQYQIRGGLGLFGNPSASESSMSSNYSLGLGYRSEAYYVDLAYRLFLYDESYSPYKLVDDNLEAVSLIEGNSHLVSVSFGVRF